LTTSAQTGVGTCILFFSSTTGVANNQLVSAANLPYGNYSASVGSFIANTSVSLMITATSVPAYVLANIASGTSISFFSPTTFTLAHFPVVPLSVSISCGLSSNLTDDGAGNLLLSGFPVGNINCTTGVCTINELIASGQAISASYSYASQAGRLLRQIPGTAINAAWYGYNLSNSNSTAALQAADTYAYNNRYSVEVPTLGTVKYPIKASAFKWMGAGVGANGVQPYIQWRPSVTFDLEPCIIADSTFQIFKDIYVGGPTNYSNNGTDILPVGTVNYAAAGDMTVYNNQMPYSSLATGVCAYWDGYHTIFDNCASNNTKVGLLLQSTAGHTKTTDCNFGPALFGIYIINNDESYSFVGGAFNGIIANVLLNDLLAAGHYGGIGGYTKFEEMDFYGALWAFLQVTCYTSPVPALGLYETVFINTGFEAVGEAYIKLLSTSKSGPITFVNVPGPDHPGSTGEGTNGIPSNWAQTNGQLQACMWFGTVSGFAYYGANNGGSITNVGAPGGANPFAYTIITAGSAGGQLFTDISSEIAFGGQNIKFVTASGSLVVNPQANYFYPSYVNSQSPPRYASMDILRIANNFAPQGNLILNPEVAANWTFQNGGTISVGSYSSFGTLPAITYSQPDLVQQLPLNINPNVIEFTAATSTLVGYEINFIGSPAVIPAPHNVGFHLWVYTDSSTPIVISFWLVGGGPASTLYNQNYTINAASGWTPVHVAGQNIPQNTSGTTYVAFRFYCPSIAIGSHIWLMNVMVHLDDWCAYTPYSGPTANEPLFLTGIPAAPTAISSPYTATQCGEVWIVGGTVTAISRVRGGVTLSYPITQTAIKVSAGDVVTVTQTGSTLYFAQQ
jgi:hypothetical protein